jgi:hypothetical protein
MNADGMSRRIRRLALSNMTRRMHRVALRKITTRTWRLSLSLAVAAAIVGGVAMAPMATAQGTGSPLREQARGQRMDPQQMINRRVAMMTQNLSLSSTQQMQIRTILTEERAQLEALRKNAANQRPEDRAAPPPEDGAPGAMRSDRGGPPPEVRAVIDRSEMRIESVLNSRQRITYRQLRQKEQQRQRPDSASHRGERSSDE